MLPAYRSDMTVATTASFSGPYVGNGSTTAFPYSFKALADAEVQVLVNGAVIGSGYSVARGANGDGGTVTFTSAPATSATILIVSTPNFTQDISFQNAGAFLPATHDEANDRAAVRAIFNRRETQRSIKAPIGEAPVDLPKLTTRASNYFAFDVNGDPVPGISIAAMGQIQSDVSTQGVRLTAAENDIDAEVVARSAGDTDVNRRIDTLQALATGPQGPIGKSTPQRRGLAPLLIATAMNRPRKVVLMKMHAAGSTFEGHCWFTPIDNVGKKWACHLFTNHFGHPANTGVAPPDLFGSFEVGLHKVIANARHPANTTFPGTEPVAPTQTILATDASVVTVGTWNAPATIEGVTDVVRPSTDNSGASKTFPFTATSTKRRIVLETYSNVSVGGIGQVTVEKESAPGSGVWAEISAGEYLPILIGTKRIYYLNQADASPLTRIPVAEVASDGSYRVKFEDAAGINYATGRLYLRALKIYPPIAVTAGSPGIHGIQKDYTLSGTATGMVLNPGSELVYDYPNTTKVVWEYVKATTAGIARLRLYNAAGALVTEQTIDMYSATQENARAVLTSGNAVPANYRLHVRLMDTKNAASTSKHRIYEVNPRASDETQAGVPGTDPFDFYDLPMIPTNSLSVGSRRILRGHNIFHTFLMRGVGDPVPTEHVGGAGHKGEKLSSTISYEIDNVDRTADFNALARYGMIVGETGGHSFTTDLFKLDNTTQWGTSSWNVQAFFLGLTVETDPNNSLSIIMHEDFVHSLSLSAPTAPETAAIGGFNTFLSEVEGDYTVDNYTTSHRLVTLANRTPGIVAVNNNGWAAMAVLLNKPAIDEKFKAGKFHPSPAPAGTQEAYIQVYAEGYAKFYNAAFPGDPANGITLNPGELNVPRKVLLFIGQAPELPVLVGRG